LTVSQPSSGTVEEICRLNFLVAEFYVEAIFKICALASVKISRIDLIGSHGQTIQHHPEKQNFLGKKIGSTLQIGEPSVIAAKTGIITVGNFRSADVALGGQGAPLIPYFDFLLFSSEQFNRVLLNIGGIANITILPKKINCEQVMAFDTGPGNMVIDALMKKFFELDYDKNGDVAQTGKISQELLEKITRVDYFKKHAPKSTGREDFGECFVNQIIDFSQLLNLRAQDIIATTTELTAQTIAEAMQFSNIKITEIDQLIVSGGGTHNKFLMNSISAKFSASTILLTDDFGIPADAKEAICFAVLANETICGNPTNLPTVTGARKAAVLGSICMS
jgi:anhydro-N-acetylmuramic acid kinase